ncbi:MAG: ImmA/IrrE family metallo-endopeptidase [Clostridiaceae bacterium]|nr:ImmA/IrrE family metallo-endopeptidase [Clostridiaceae bacterium]
MAALSFAEYVKNKCYNGLYREAEFFVSENWESMNLYTRNVHRIGSVEMLDATIQRVYVRDLPGTRVAFEVGLELELNIKEGDYHYDEYDQCYPWIRIYCEGDLSCGLDDWKIIKVESYSRKNAPSNSLSDALVPYIPYEQLDNVATQLLKDNYPDALKITPYGEPPISVDPLALANNLGLEIHTQRICEDASIFGQMYFNDADTKMYDANLGQTVPIHINEKTIVVDPQMYLLRNLGSVNNTIIHECVHWILHRKVFLLEKLYNSDASCISCEVVGGAASSIARSATEKMEKQANQLAPRIQMPAEPFKTKAREYIARFMREANAKHSVDVMENVITALETDYGVSRQAAKLRLVELGFDEAIGTYTFLDGHYVKPHGFKKGSIKINQTFSLSAQDAAIERFVNPELHSLTETGDYVFVDNHYVYNAPLYVQPSENGALELTDYARAHMDECCLVFDMRVMSKIGDEYHTICFLNREPSDVTFEIKFHNGFQNAPQQRQVAMRMKLQKEALEIRKKMTDDPEQCMELLLNWRNMKYTDLGDAIGRDPKTISRTVKGTTRPTVETAALICFGLNLPPIISTKLMEVFGCPIHNSMNTKYQWINEALQVKYPEPLHEVQRYLAQYGVEL